jgi:hypothetical protein
MRIDTRPAMRPVIANRNCCISVAVALILLNCTSCKPKKAEQEFDTSAAVLSSRGAEISQLWPAIKSASFGVLAQEFGTHLTVQTHSEHSNIQIFEYLTKLPNLLQGERFGASEIHYTDLFAKAAVFDGDGVIDFTYYPIRNSSLGSASCYFVEIVDIHLPNLGISWKSPGHFSEKWNSRGATALALPKYVKKICFGLASPSIEG